MNPTGEHLMTLQIELTGNEARLVFYAIKNKKSILAENVREKLILASEKNFLKRQHKGYNRQHNGQTGNTNRSEEG